jgi:hypothetical protein
MTKHLFRHAVSVGAMAFMWVEVLDLVGGIETSRAISAAWKAPLGVAVVAATIGITIYVLTTQIPLLARMRKREMEASK